MFELVTPVEILICCHPAVARYNEIRRYSIGAFVYAVGYSVISFVAIKRYCLCEHDLRYSKAAALLSFCCTFIRRHVSSFVLPFSKKCRSTCVKSLNISNPIMYPLLVPQLLASVRLHQ